MPQTLEVCEIFRSIQGEGTRAGLPCVLVRLAGCNIRCRWCDSTYALDRGTVMDVDDILARVRELNCPLVEVTGGEPLMQAHTPLLLERLAGRHGQVLLETNGSLDISLAPPGVVRIMDVKCPSSGQAQSFLADNIGHLRPDDEVKFVIADQGDYEYAVEVISQHRLADRCHVLLSPAAGLLPPARLAEWMLGDGRLGDRARLSLQLHRVIWPDRDRGV